MSDFLVEGEVKECVGPRRTRNQELQRRVNFFFLGKRWRENSQSNGEYRSFSQKNKGHKGPLT